MIYRLIVFASVVALVIAVLVIGRGAREAAPGVRALSEIEQPGYSARDAQVVETGPDGRPRYRLTAELIEQQPRDGSIRLESIAMRYRTEDGADWRLTAERGLMPQSARRIELEGDVRVTGVPTGSRSPATISTERLQLDTQTEQVTTREPVALEWSGVRLTARGMVADLKAERLSLESDVDGRFTPR
jgi:LPS export ABC transporter protein LptC